MNHTTSDAYKSSYTNRYRASNTASWRDIGMVLNRAIVIDCSARVDDAIFADAGVGIHNRSGKYDCARTDSSARGNDGCWMQHHCWCLTYRFQLYKYLFAQLIIAKSDDEVCRSMALGKSYWLRA